MRTLSAERIELIDALVAEAKISDPYSLDFLRDEPIQPSKFFSLGLNLLYDLS